MSRQLPQPAVHVRHAGVIPTSKTLSPFDERDLYVTCSLFQKPSCSFTSPASISSSSITSRECCALSFFRLPEQVRFAVRGRRWEICVVACSGLWGARCRASRPGASPQKHLLILINDFVHAEFALKQLVLPRHAQDNLRKLNDECFC